MRRAGPVTAEKKICAGPDRRALWGMNTRRTFLAHLGVAPLLLSACGRGLAQASKDAGVCAPTDSNIEGPFFKRGAPVRSRLAAKDEPGVPLALAGSVVGPDCQPLKDVTMQVWQADRDGAYDNSGDRFRARLELRDGRFEIATIVPGRYLNGSQYRPAHIHVKLAAAGFAPLTTQLYFPGDPYNTRDPFFLPSLLVAAKKTKAGGIDARYKFALAR
jgi:protocatechuate 3,4-dioxygenase beta subunit